MTSSIRRISTRLVLSAVAAMQALALTFGSTPAHAAPSIRPPEAVVRALGLTTAHAVSLVQLICYTRAHVEGFSGSLLTKRACDAGEKAGSIIDTYIRLSGFN